MKKLLTLFLATLMVIMAVPAGAVSSTEVYRETEIIHTEDGDIEVETILTIHDSLFRANARTASKTKTYTASGNTIAEVTLTATFRYDGSTVSVTNTDSSYSTYDGWSYKNESISTSGGTATLTAKLTKLLHTNVSVSVSMTCTPSGSIS